MGETITLTLYHGTDFSSAQRICGDSFTCRKNSEHWLGNGVYFFTDKALAEWWTGNPTNKFSARIEDPAIVTCELTISSDYVLDISTLEGYKEYAALFDDFLGNYPDEAKRKMKDNIKIKEVRNQLRCAFFDYISLLYDKALIIAPFHLPGQPYLPKEHEYLKEFCISYTEVQVCLSENRQEFIHNLRAERIKV